MSLFAQHGHGKGVKILDAVKAGNLDGVIFSARNEKPANIKSCISELKAIAPTVKAILDPQFFISMLKEPRDMCLPEYWNGYYRPNRSRRDFRGPKAFRDHAKNTLEAQLDLNLDYLVAPTLHFRSFDDIASEQAMQLAFASGESHAQMNTAKPLLINLLIEESALDHRAAFLAFLDELTAAEFNGFYLTLARSDKTRWPRCRDTVLARIMYMVYVLRLNGKDVHCGYADWGGLLFQAVGAKSFASGWFQSLRTFRLNAFCGQGTRGRQVPYYSSAPLLTSIRIADLQQIDRGDLSRFARSQTPSDEKISEGWSLGVSYLQHWETLKKLSATLTDDVETNLESITNRLSLATAAFQQLDDYGLVLTQPNADAHLADWREAIQEFKRLAEL